MTPFSLPPDTQINLSVLRSCGQGTQLLHWTWLICHKESTGTQTSGISLLRRKTRTQMDPIQHSPAKEMEISNAKVNAVLQESLDLSQFCSPPSTSFLKGRRILSKLLRWQNTIAIIRALWSQSIPGRHTVTTLHHQHPVPAWPQQPRQRNPSLCNQPLQAARNNPALRSPATAQPPEKRSAELQHLTPLTDWSSVFKSPHEVLLSVSYLVTAYIVPKRNMVF